MKLESKTIQKIYSGKVARHYDLPISHIFKKYKQLAFRDASIKKGDTVLVFCCGTGLDFPYILKLIGKEGKIIGVDFSSAMLEKAKEKVSKYHWDNIELVNADITDYENKLAIKADVGVCTLGMSIIPEYNAAYYNLLSNVKVEGEIIIGDMQLASGWLARFNPVTIFLAKKYGGTHEGHRNSLALCEHMEKELSNSRKRSFFFNSYYYCIGNKTS